MIEKSRVRVSAGAAGEFSSPGSTFCAESFRYPFHPRVTAIARKQNLGHSARSAGGSLQLNTHTPYIYMALHEVTYAWLYGVHRTCAETAAVSCGISYVSAVSTPLSWIYSKHAL